MPRKKSFITVTDQFCGAGGSGQGAKKSLDKAGGELSIGLNHWKLATETYNTNFPNTQVDCTDVSACDPRRYPSTTGLITSPECTTHSPAGGNNHKTLKKQMDLFNTGKIDPATERSRATMWDVCRFAEYHKYEFIIVENVVEAKTRWPLFDDWLRCMHTLGYDHRCIYHNSMHHHPTPQSRDRMYIVFWKRGNRAPNLEFNPLAYCIKCDRDTLSVQTWKKQNAQYGKYRQQYVYCCPACTSVVEPYYYASFNCIDWSDIGKKIGERKKPLKPKTIDRIEFGRKKYHNNPFLVQIAYSGSSRGITRSVFDPHYSQTTVSSQAIVQPLIVKLEHSQRSDNVKPVGESLSTQTVRQSMMLVNPFIINNQHSSGVDFRVKGVAETIPTIQTTHQLNLVTPPFIIKGEHSMIDPLVRHIGEELQTQMTRQTMALVSPPFLTELYGTGTARPITEAVNTITAGGGKTGIITTESWNSFMAQYYNGSHCVTHITDASGTFTTNDRSGLVTYNQPSLEDCYYRMLKPMEIKVGMAFDPNYKILGSGKDQVRQCGNAVTPPAMEWLVDRCIESLNNQNKKRA